MAQLTINKTLPPVTDAELEEDFTGPRRNLSTRQNRVVEIAFDHLVELEASPNADGSASAVKYALDQLLYADRGANDVKILVAATVDHLRQSGVLTPAERRELFGLSDVAA
jgi:hypothetical protein